MSRIKVIVILLIFILTFSSINFVLANGEGAGGESAGETGEAGPSGSESTDTSTPGDGGADSGGGDSGDSLTAICGNNFCGDIFCAEFEDISSISDESGEVVYDIKSITGYVTNCLRWETETCSNCPQDCGNPHCHDAGKPCGSCGGIIQADCTCSVATSK